MRRELDLSIEARDVIFDITLNDQGDFVVHNPEDILDEEHELQLNKQVELAFDRLKFTDTFQVDDVDPIEAFKNEHYEW